MPNNSISIKTRSPKETKKLAGVLAQEILQSKIKKPKRSAIILALAGNLGSGKTTFAQGFLRGLGIRSKITSPTFVLVKRYKLKCFKFHASCFTTAFHIDCYRIKKPNELAKLGLKEILNNPQNIVLIEWPEKIHRALPKNTIWLKFEHGPKENQRKMVLLYKNSK